MKSIKCLVFLGLLVASVSAAPGFIDSISRPFSSSVADSVAQSQSSSLGGNFGIGPFSIGGNLNSASSKTLSSASTVNSGGYERVPSYRSEYEPTFGGVSESHAAAQAQSDAHSLGGGLGFGPFKIGANLNSAHSEAHSSASAVNSNYERVPSLHRPGYGPEYGIGQAAAQANAQAVAGSQGDFRRYY